MVVPAGTGGPVAVSAAVYYQSVEAMVALKFLGNLADTDHDFLLEPCVLGGACDGRAAQGEPAVVEGSPPVPMEVRSRVIAYRRTGDAAALAGHLSAVRCPGRAARRGGEGPVLGTDGRRRTKGVSR